MQGVRVGWRARSRLRLRLLILLCSCAILFLGCAATRLSLPSCPSSSRGRGVVADGAPRSSSSLIYRMYLKVVGRVSRIASSIPLLGWFFRKQHRAAVQPSKHLGRAYKPTDANYRIQKELKEFIQSPPPNCKVSVGSNIRVWIITITGANGTIYEGEKYKLKVIFPQTYPRSPPSVFFLKPTPRHVHVYSNGDICLNLLGRDWRSSLTVSSLATSILSMLSSAKEKKLPPDNANHADRPAGQAQDNFLYHDDNC